MNNILIIFIGSRALFDDCNRLEVFIAVVVMRGLLSGPRVTGSVPSPSYCKYYVIDKVNKLSY